MGEDRYQDTSANRATPPTIQVAATAIDPTLAPSYFFTTSTVKLVLMSLCTFGIYELYWFYQNWARIRSRTGASLSPFWRAFFAPIWAYVCFKNIETASVSSPSDASHKTYRLHSGGLAVIYFVIYVTWELPGAYWLISLLSFLPLIPANSAAKTVNIIRALDVNNDNLTIWNWVGIVVGGVLLALSIIGSFAQRD